MKKRMLSLLLTLVMVLGMLPATTMTANAEMYIGVDTWEELVEELTTGDYGYIKLTADLKCSHEKGSSGHVKTVINGDKTLDLNGYTIECKDESNLVASGEWNVTSNKTLFSVPAGATLTVNDSGTDGKIFYDGGMVGCSSYVTSYQYSVASPSGKRYCDYTERDIFDVDGTLIINDGTIQAGRKEKQWIFRGVHCDTSWTKYLDWNGNAQQQIWGTSVNVHSTGKLVVNGGNLSGRGMDVSENDPYCWPSYRDEVICIDKGGKAYINDGTFTGNGGADVFAGNGVDEGLQIRGGTFKTDKHDTLRVLDWSYKSAMGRTETKCPASGCGFYGHLGIPSSAYLHRQKIIINGKTYVGPFGSEIDLMKTGAVTHGWSEPVDDGKKMEVTFLPYAIDKLPVTLNGGPYSNYPVSDGQVIDWNAKSDSLVATVDYDPYFADTTGLKNAAPVYTWHLLGHYGTNGEVSKDIVTTTGELDISAAWEEAAGTGNFRQMKVSCVVSEAPTNCAYRMETKTYEFRLKPTKTPLDESSMPGGKMKVDISYPAFSGLGSDIVVTVKPSAEDLADAAYGSSTVRYEYLYRDNMEEWEDEPHAWPHNTYNIPMPTGVT